MTQEKTIRDEMTEAGQGWALTGGEHSASSGDVEEIREVLVDVRELSRAHAPYRPGVSEEIAGYIERALAALARAQESERNVEDDLDAEMKANRMLRDSMENFRETAVAAIHARDRAIDQKHKVVLERNNLRTELERLQRQHKNQASNMADLRSSRDAIRRELKAARKEHVALKAAQEPSGAEIANYREREAGLIKRAEASDRLTELLPAQNAKLREELVALRKDLRFGDADAQNLAALTEEQALTIDYLHRRLADKESPEAEDEPTGAVHLTIDGEATKNLVTALGWDGAESVTVTPWIVSGKPPKFTAKTPRLEPTRAEMPDQLTRVERTLRDWGPIMERMDAFLEERSGRDKDLKITELPDETCCPEDQVYSRIHAAITIMDEAGRTNPEGNSTMLWFKEWSLVRSYLFHAMQAEEARIEKALAPAEPTPADAEARALCSAMEGDLMSSNDKVREALEAFDGPVHKDCTHDLCAKRRLVKEALAALGEEPCGEAEDLAREVEGSYGCAVLPFDSWAARIRSIAGLPAKEKP